MRSKGLDVTKIATQFGGGGHVRAAGCSIARPFAEAKAALLAAIAKAMEPQA
jgi:phosphoesterase RecJ-like protein